MTATVLSKIRGARFQAFERVALLPNVVGSMIGRKIVGGRMTKLPCLTILVSQKVARKKLAPSKRIPATIHAAKRDLLIDVIAMPAMQPQAGTFDPGAQMTNDTYENGTLSCLCRSEFGVFGLSCAHSLDGADQDITTPTPVAMYSRRLQRFEAVGESRIGIRALGMGAPGDFGFLDAGIFDVRHPELLSAAANLPAMTPRAAVPGMYVYGQGAMRGPRSGRVIGVEQVVQDLRADVVIEVAPPGTFKGDSGMLWRTREGLPVAIHAMGQPAGPDLGSRLTVAMLASRAARYLGVDLLAPLA